jgi:hypothetical protein
MTNTKTTSIKTRALDWWRNLDYTQKVMLATKYKGRWPFEMVDSNTSTIEQIFTQHNLSK